MALHTVTDTANIITKLLRGKAEWWFQNVYPYTSTLLLVRV